MNFNFLSYSTIYSVKGDSHLDMRKRACFSDIFYNSCLTQEAKAAGKTSILNNIYTIRIYKFNTNRIDCKDNNCLLDKTTLKTYLNELKGFFKYNYLIRECETCYTLTIKIDAHLLIHKILLTCIRNVYEYPFNCILNDIYRCREDELFKNEHIINLTILFLNSFSSYEVRNNHSLICTTARLISKEEWLTRIGKEIKIDNSEARVQSSFHYVNSPVELSYISYSYSDNYWLKEDQFQKRLEVYKNNYNELKNIIND